MYIWAAVWADVYILLIYMYIRHIYGMDISRGPLYDI